MLPLRRGVGLPRFAGACLLAGQGWLGVSGAIWLGVGQPVEGAAYFVVSEALTNVARHAGARSAQVAGWVHGDRLVVAVTDDGRGGARVGGGSGLAGLVTRLDVLGGTLTVRSPEGGPTEVRMECPCVS